MLPGTAWSLSSSSNPSESHAETDGMIAADPFPGDRADDVRASARPADRALADRTVRARAKVLIATPAEEVANVEREIRRAVLQRFRL